MQSWWMQMTDTATALELRDVPVPDRRRPASCSFACTPPRSTAASSCSATACTASRAAGRRSAAKARARSSPSAPKSPAFEPGDRVMGRCAGAFSEYALMEAARGDGGARQPVVGRGRERFRSTFLVAFDMLVLQGRLKAGEWLLVNGVSSGVGVASLQLGKALGAQRHRHFGLGRQAGRARSRSASTSRCARAARLRAGGHGGDRRHGADLDRQHRRRLGVRRERSRPRLRGPARDGGLRRRRAARRDRPRGAACEAPDAVRRLQQAAHARSSGRPPCRASSPRSMPQFAAGRIRPRIDRVFDFAQLGDAKARMEAGAHVGKIVLRMPVAS